jgi:hypothetical protein
MSLENSDMPALLIVGIRDISKQLGGQLGTAHFPGFWPHRQTKIHIILIGGY